MSGPTAFDDPTLARWRVEQEKIDRQRAQEEAERARVRNAITELEDAFRRVRRGIPDMDDKEQSARAFAENWAQIPPLLSKHSDFVCRHLDAIHAEPDSAKEYALRFVRTAMTDVRNAAKMLLGSWETSKALHGQVLHWLTGALELEILGERAGRKSQRPSREQESPKIDQPVSASGARQAQRRPDVQITPRGADDNGDPGASQRRQRLQFDPHTQTITLDGTPYKIVDPKAYDVYETIANSCPRPQTRAKLQDVVSGCRGDKKIRRLIDSLPKPLCKTISSNPNGYWLDLDPPSKRRKRRPGKKGRT